MSRDHRVTHRAARLPLDISAGGGTVDNPTSQGFTYRQQNPVQLNRTSSNFCFGIRKSHSDAESIVNKMEAATVAALRSGEIKAAIEKYR